MFAFLTKEDMLIFDIPEEVHSVLKKIEDPDIQAKTDEIAVKLGSSGRILVRESGTEPVLRIMAEAKTEELCSEYVSEIADLIRSKGYCTDSI